MSLNLKIQNFKKEKWSIMSRDKNIHNIFGKKDFWANNFVKHITVLKSGKESSKFVGNKGKTK